MNKSLIMPTVLILAAGKGQRMLPLTLNTPKPLLKVAGVSLLDRHLSKLNASAAPTTTNQATPQTCQVIINIAHLGQQIADHIDQSHYPNLSFTISDERDSGALETAGGIIKALPLISTELFLVINADIFTDLDLLAFCHRAEQAMAKGNSSNMDAYLGLVENPKHNLSGDFYLDKSGAIQSTPTSSYDAQRMHTFAGVGLYRKTLFENLPSGSRPLAPLLRSAIQRGVVAGELLSAQWVDVGTPERLAELDQSLAQYAKG